MYLQVRKKWKRTKYWQRKSKKREYQMKNNTSMSEEAKVGVVDKAIIIDLSSAGSEFALSWSPMQQKILRWRPEFHNWSPVGD